MPPRGAEILSPNGTKIIWFHAAPSGQEISDFREQTYDGKPVLTFWPGTGLGGLSTGTDEIYNADYQRSPRSRPVTATRPMVTSS